MRVTQGRVGELEPNIRGIVAAPDVVLDLLALSLAAQGRLAEPEPVSR